MSADPRWQRLITGVKFDVDRAPVPTSDGGEVPREVVVHPGSVVILPLLDDGRVVLIRNRRFAVGRTLWELPAGTLDPGEDPRDCAARELVEEAGYRAAELAPLLSLWVAPGWCTERIHVFVARRLTAVGQRLEPTEQIEVAPRDWADVLSMLRSGAIDDGKTICALLYFRAFGAGGLQATTP